MTLSDVSIKNPVFAWMLMAGLIVFGAIGPPVVSKSNPEDQPIIWLAVSGDRPFREMTEYVKNHIKDRLTTVSGVGEMFMGGFLEPNLRVWLDAERMERTELTVEDVLGAIEAGHAEVPAGYLDTGSREINIRVMGEASTPESFSKIIIPSRRGAPIWKAFLITTQFIRASIRELTFNLVLSGLLTSLVCFLFLGSWSATLNVLLAIPTAIIGAFIALYFFGFTLNTFTMLGFSLVIGIVVDDAIMVLENISRYREAGVPRVRAAIMGAREITFAALAASVAILAIFVPVIFMQGIIGKFFFQFGITISVAVMLSLLEALTIAPMRCAQFLEIQRGTWVRAADRAQAVV
ncbi:MAG: efflux RND transporter permease subunit [Elusimicrobia bacterium]|nr:efflux RND transporter permease subunit [Elusimicrobiota bacterium]